MDKYLLRLLCLLIAEVPVIFFAVITVHNKKFERILFLLFLVGLAIFLLWYFFVWKPLKRKNELSLAVKSTNSILVLFILLVVAVFSMGFLMFFVDGYFLNHFKFHNSRDNNKINWSCSDVRLYENGDTVKLDPFGGVEINGVKIEPDDELSYEGTVWREYDCLKYVTLERKFIVFENENDKIGKVLKSVRGDDVGFHCTNGEYYTFRYSNAGEEVAYSNVYGPDGKFVFEKDLKTGWLCLYDTDDGIIINDSETGIYYDKNGNQVNNIYTFYDRYNKVIFWTFIILSLIISTVLWYIYSWKRRKD
ncbi:MAG: hypothetical protein IKW83_07445 [Muribaculaceae bacterium]|nr:hypothetical protein [Muribaculaceae bacterium]